jgi:hypothetical protein
MLSPPAHSSVKADVVAHRLRHATQEQLLARADSHNRFIIVAKPAVLWRRSKQAPQAQAINEQQPDGHPQQCLVSKQQMPSPQQHLLLARYA